MGLLYLNRNTDIVKQVIGPRLKKKITTLKLLGETNN